jgi:hypothetical protein
LFRGSEGNKEEVAVKAVEKAVKVEAEEAEEVMKQRANNL